MISQRSNSLVVCEKSAANVKQAEEFNAYSKTKHFFDAAYRMYGIMIRHTHRLGSKL